MHPKSKRTKSGIDLDLKRQKNELQCTNVTRILKPVFNPDGVGGRKAWTAASSSSCQLSSSTAQALEILMKGLKNGNGITFTFTSCQGNVWSSAMLNMGNSKKRLTLVCSPSAPHTTLSPARVQPPKHILSLQTGCDMKMLASNSKCIVLTLSIF